MSQYISQYISDICDHYHKRWNSCYIYTPLWSRTYLFVAFFMSTVFISLFPTPAVKILCTYCTLSTLRPNSFPCETGMFPLKWILGNTVQTKYMWRESSKYSRHLVSVKLSSYLPVCTLNILRLSKVNLCYFSLYISRCSEKLTVSAGFSSIHVAF